ncbi:MAG: hypothetical protein U5R06_17795 [candidate division KSB1 bacterium]|nr:hypothetical protein [candidate division KSB1 bacterium]
MENLKDLVYSLCSGAYSQSQLVDVVNIMQKISLSYLKYQQVMGKRISSERNNTYIELEDLSIDCIAELFSRDSDGRFHQLQRYYLPRYEENADISDEDVLMLTRRLVVRKTKQELSRIFRERDPEGAKIVRNIKVAVRSSEKLAMFSEMGRDYVFYKNGLELEPGEPLDPHAIADYLRRKNPPVPLDLLHTRFIEFYSPSDSVSGSIRRLMKTVHELKKHQNFLALDALTKLVREAKFDTARENLKPDDYSPTPLDELETREIESYIDVTMTVVREKIKTQYLQANKLDPERAIIYEKALRDVLFDLVQKNINSSYFKNLKYYIPRLTQKEYRCNERSIFEYLAKVAKREFRGHLKSLL